MPDNISIYETLHARADAGGNQAASPRASSMSFMDTYSQTTYIGAVKVDKSITYTLTGSYAEVVAVDTFLNRNIDSPFWYRFFDEEPERLWRVDDQWNFKHDVGLRWQLTATFKQASLYRDSISSDDLNAFANKLNEVVNIILPRIPL